MARHKVTVRLDDDDATGAYDGLLEICEAWNVSQTAFIQAVIEASVDAYRSGNYESRNPVRTRSAQIDTQRRRRAPL